MISLVATVRAPREDLERFVAYHLNTGVDHIDLFFDDPADPSLDAFAGIDQVSATPCTVAHWQAAGVTPDHGIEARQLHNAALALVSARARGAQWLLHVDSDELIHTPVDDVAAWLAARSAEIDGVIFPVLEAIPRWPARRHPFQACRMFKAMPRPDPKRLDLAARMGCRRALRYGHFRGHLLGKAATRVTADINALGIHYPTSGRSLKIEHASDGYVLHYDSCTFEAWRQKWARRKDGSGLALTMRPDRRRQFTDFLAADASSDRAELEREFRRQCVIPLHEQAILWALGLARPVRLDRALFDAPG